VWRKDLVEFLAIVLVALGTERAWVVHGEDGLDEITLAGKTFVAEAGNGKVKMFEIGPEDFGLFHASLDHLRGGNPEANACIIREILSGERRDEARALVVANAAAALYVGGKAQALKGAAELAELSINSGAAGRKLDELVRATNS
jgi:anthranilate phosphoribosyltransferase